MQIETTRLVLRSFVEADAQAVSFNSNQPIVARFMSDMVLETVEDARRWIAWIAGMCNDHEPCQVLAIERKADAAVIGLMGVAPKKEIGNELEILFAVADPYQNAGYATEAAKALIWWAFEQVGQDVLAAIVKPANKASRRVIDKLGFVYCDTRILPYDGEDCTFDYFRLHHTDTLPGPEWDARELYKAEPMDAFFDVRAEGYDEHMLSISNDFGEKYARLGGFVPATQDAIRILDIGCGTGLELEYIWGQAPNAHITCVDVSRDMLALLCKNHGERLERITAVEASYVDWQYPASAYDLVISSMTMHHLWPEEKAGVYRKILASLKPGGQYIENDFIVDETHAEQYRRRYAIIMEQVQGKAQAGEYHVDIPCSLEVQKGLLLEVGFASVEVLDDQIGLRGSSAILRAVK